MEPDGRRPGPGDEPIAEIESQLVSLETRWLAPLPHPRDLREYESVLPGSAERIVKMAENAADVRNDALRETTKAEIDYAKSGQSLAFLLTLIAIAAAIGFFWAGNNIAGCAFLSVPVLMLIKAFLLRGRPE